MNWEFYFTLLLNQKLIQCTIYRHNLMNLKIWNSLVFFFISISQLICGSGQSKLRHWCMNSETYLIHLHFVACCMHGTGNCINENKLPTDLGMSMLAKWAICNTGINWSKRVSDESKGETIPPWENWGSGAGHRTELAVLDSGLNWRLFLPECFCGPITQY